jgi:hypothetical protein
MLRIPFSLTCGIVCLLLILLWVRSYWWQDVYPWRLSDHCYLLTASGRGWIMMRFSSYKPGFDDLKKLQFESGSTTYIPQWNPDYIPEPSWSWRFAKPNWGTWIKITAQHWCLVIIASALAGTTWVNWSWRFRLRVMLVATTLLALLFGAIGCAIR